MHTILAQHTTHTNIITFYNAGIIVAIQTAKVEMSQSLSTENLNSTNSRSLTENLYQMIADP